MAEISDQRGRQFDPPSRRRVHRARRPRRRPRTTPGRREFECEPPRGAAVSRGERTGCFRRKRRPRGTLMHRFLAQRLCIRLRFAARGAYGHSVAARVVAAAGTAGGLALAGVGMVLAAVGLSAVLDRRHRERSRSRGLTLRLSGAHQAVFRMTDCTDPMSPRTYMTTAPSRRSLRIVGSRA